MTTLIDIRNANPCIEGWRNLLLFMGKSAADATPVEWADQKAANRMSFAVFTLPEYFAPEQIENLRAQIGAAAGTPVPETTSDRDIGTWAVGKGGLSEETLSGIVSKWEAEQGL